MAFPPAFLDEIRARVSLAQVIGRKVKLVRAGREMKGCCPFHNEKTPSFYINEDKGFYHCFGCGVHGDVIRFVVEQEGLRFPDAVRQLAAEAGLDVPEETPEARAKAQKAAGLHDVTGRAAQWYTEQLAGIAGAAARQYLERRQIRPDIARRFSLGFAPDGRTKLKTALKDIGEAKLIETGLLVAAEERNETYDRFRNRLMFPIRDPRGRVIGFGGRIVGDGQPKYLNSPDTPLFDKGRQLYNLDQAGPVARKSQRLFVVEGYMDVIALAQAGIDEAVAPLGTALTEQQLQLLWRVVPEPLLCFDGDAAGQRAAVRAATRALPLLEPGKSLRFVTLPPGQDPDDLVRGQGAAAFEAVAAAAEPLIDKLWRVETEGVEAGTPERRAMIRERLREHAQAISHAEVRRLYEAEFRMRFDAIFAARPRDWQKGRQSGRSQYSGTQRYFGERPVSNELRLLRQRGAMDAELTAVLVGLIEHPQLAADHAEMIAHLPVGESRLARLRAAILDAAAHDPHLDKAGLAHTLAVEGLGALAEEVRRSNRLAFSFTRAQTPLALANRDLACVVDSLMARHRVGQELSRLQVEYRAAMNVPGLTEEQQLRLESMRTEQERLVAEQQRAEQELMRLAQQWREQSSAEAN